MKTFSIACLAALLATSAGATTVRYADLDDLVGLADGIVVGTVASRESRPGPDHEIYTFVTFADLDIIKGVYGAPNLTLRFQGGSVDDETLEVEGSPRFDLDDRVILFVRGNGKDIVPIVGWTQGVLRIKANADAVEKVLDHDGNRVLRVRGKLLLKERKHPASLRIVGAPALMQRQSRTAKRSPGVGDDGSSSAALRMTVPRAAAELALTAPEFLDALRQKASARALASASITALGGDAELRSVDGFEGIEPVANEAPGGGASDNGAVSDPSAAVALPQRQR